ncbi:hypothetical protein Y032_0919g3042 [Ancylostoma ceylanicum]|nr:hypothetical protein Y032_0919g3042 [Ancylostoma ceylanicum]
MSSGDQPGIASPQTDESPFLNRNNSFIHLALFHERKVVTRTAKEEQNNDEEKDEEQEEEAGTDGKSATYQEHTGAELNMMLSL